MNVKSKAILVVLSTGLLFSSTHSYANSTDLSTYVLEAQHSSIMLLEDLKIMVLEDLRSVLTMTNDKDFNEVKRDSKFTPEFKDVFFGASFNTYRSVKADSVSFIDAQYTLPSAEDNYSIQGKDVMFSIEAEVRKGADTKRLSFVVLQKDGLVYDIQVF